MTEQLFCPIRKGWVAALPEERVRQYWLQRMIQELDYPAEGFAVEKGLRQIPHLALSPVKLPTRRADIIFFSRGFPFILIECKAVKLTNAAERQIIGYNHFLKSPFLALANQEEIRFGWYDSKDQQYCFRQGIPDYRSLKAMDSK